MTGLMSINGDAEHRPAADRHARWSISPPGSTPRSRILMALHERAHSGRGQFLDMTLYDCGMALLHPQAANFFLNGKRRPVPLGNPHPNIAPYEKFPDAHLRDLHRVRQRRAVPQAGRALGRPELRDDPRFADQRRPLANRAALTEALRDAFAEQDGNVLADQLLRQRRARRAGAGGG